MKLSALSLGLVICCLITLVVGTRFVIVQKVHPNDEEDREELISMTGGLDMVVVADSESMDGGHVTGGLAAVVPRRQGQYSLPLVSGGMNSSTGDNGSLLAEGRRQYRSMHSKALSLGYTLNSEEIKEQYRFMQQKQAEYSSLSFRQLNGVKNVALDKLIHQKKMPEDLGRRIVGMFNDKGMDDQWRDYALQHFSLYHEKKWPNGVPPDNDPEASLIHDAYWKALDETHNTIAGVALIGLQSVSETDPRYDRKKVADSAVSLAKRSDVSVHVKITAMQVCGVMGVTEILPEARAVAEEADTHVLKISAIATIGDVGEARDVAFLRKLLQQSGTGKLKKAVETAIEKISSRQIR